ncbi:orphan sodium- and chloride-dependent neurotransmitter transporter NTT5 isoform X2 [Artibeus jamaicensis]|uniref:orphan sodium- and chloride-dependent neurotransmitter transporter NTT5 isoform X2 n=1 Tax=Artibeus jamaicensis TaxID=9417 RepID=UPI00235A67F1|nr:orphan sodium- and chloride-dependent neurotransmitter transporter NTT5 isoform X2 [Artibeus jamaicensis]
MRSTRGSRLSSGFSEDTKQGEPGVKTEAQPSESSVKTASFTDSSLSDSLSGSQVWENKGLASLAARASDTETLAARAAKAEAWETQASEGQRMGTRPKKTFTLGVKSAQPLKQKPLIKKTEVPEKKKKKKKSSEVPDTRPLWSNKVEYMLAQVGYSVRAINLWRFPYLWLHNGGWSFFIIYLFLLLLVGIPLLFLEMAVGQRMHQGSMGVWKIIGPWVGGVGYTSFMVCLIASLYCNVFNAWILTYLCQAFKYSTPWEHCPLLKNSSDFDPECQRTTPSMYFWYRSTLKASDSIEDSGPPVLGLSILYLLSWCLVGTCVIFGLKSLGKVMYVLVPLTYVILLCFFIRGPLLEGAVFGLQHLKIWKIPALYDVAVWCFAGIQVLFTLGLGYGPVVSLSSYVDSSNNCLQDAFVVALVNLGCMMLATPAIFCVLGFWATIITDRCSEKNADTLSSLVIMGKLPPEAKPPENLGEHPAPIFFAWLSSLPPPIHSRVLSHLVECDIEKQFLKVKEGPNFAFLAFIEAMSFAPGSVFWTILHLLMLLTLGLNVMLGTLQGIVTPLQDSCSSFRMCPKLFTVLVLVLLFLCGLFFTQPSGIYYVELLSEYWMVLPIILIVTFENVAVAWAYGARRFLADLAILWGRSIHPIFHWLWCAVSPILLLMLLAATLILLSLENLSYRAWDSSTSKQVLRQYPTWVLLSMISLFVIVILPIPVYFVYCLTQGIPFKPAILDRPIKDVPEESVLQDDNQTADPPAAV